jgi:BNR/Asp-box repeat
MKYLLLWVLVFVSSGVVAQFKNIRLAEEKEGRGAPGEPSVIINHREPNNIVAAMGRDLVVYTTDGGQTWQESIVSSPLGTGSSAAMIVDAKGNIYDFHRAEGEKPGEGFDRIVCQRSDDLGKTWNDGSGIGGNSTKKNDKLGVAVNARKQILYATWTQYDKYPSEEAGCQSYVMFSMATNAGNRWDKPIAVSQTPGNCQHGGGSIAGATPAVGIDGRIYLSWSNAGVIYFDRSYDEGKTWLINDLPIAKQEGGWMLNIPGFGPTSNMPVLVIDNSPGRYHGMLYMVFADQRSGSNDTDVWMQRSNRYGDSWAAPYKINKDAPGKHQFSPAMAIDQASGTIYVAYYDRRAYEDSNTDVYLAYSVDGGVSFNEVKISEQPFIATEVPFYDHISITAHNGMVVPVWTRIDDGKVSVWTTVIQESQVRK